MTELDSAKAFLWEKPSTSYLQRKMSITYNHASRLMETLENEGFISKPDPAGRRTVLQALAVSRPVLGTAEKTDGSQS